MSDEEDVFWLAFQFENHRFQSDMMSSVSVVSVGMRRRMKRKGNRPRSEKRRLTGPRDRGSSLLADNDVDTVPSAQFRIPEETWLEFPPASIRRSLQDSVRKLADVARSFLDRQRDERSIRNDVVRKSKSVGGE